MALGHAKRDNGAAVTAKNVGREEGSRRRRVGEGVREMRRERRQGGT